MDIIELSIKVKNRIFSLIMPSFYRIRAIQQVACGHDMFRLPDEQFFGGIYLKKIMDKLSYHFKQTDIKIVDLGCGQGRLLVPLALAGYDITGVDFTKESIQSAENNLKLKNLNAKLICEDIGKFLASTDSYAYNVVLCLEVLYLMKDAESILKDTIRILKKGGLLIVSLRTKYHTVLHMLNSKYYQRALKLAKAPEDSFLTKDDFNAFTKEGAIAMLSRLGIKNIECFGIGVVSGIDGDPQGRFVLPSSLNTKEKEGLFKLENELSCDFADCGRYILVSGEKNG